MESTDVSQIVAQRGYIHVLYFVWLNKYLLNIDIHHIASSANIKLSKHNCLHLLIINYYDTEYSS